MGTKAAAKKNLAKVKKPGRPKGSKNKFTTLKQSFLDAFVGIGGAGELQKWAKDNQKDFYNMVSKLLPKEIAGDIDVTVHAPDLNVNFQKVPDADNNPT